MSDLFDINPNEKLMAFLVGPNGSGKSIAIGSWLDKGGSVYFFDYDGRMNSVSDWYMRRGLRRGQLLSDTYGPSNLYAALEKLDKFIDYCPHIAIAIDSFTAVTVSAVMGSLRNRTKSGTQAKSKGELTIPDWDEWNAEATYVTMLLDLCKTIAAKGIAVFWTGHPVQRMKIVGKTYSTQTKYAAFGMKSDSLVPIYFNEIWHFAVSYDLIEGRNKRVCFTEPEGEVNAKTALNLPGQIEWTNGNFYQIFTDLVEKGRFKREITENKEPKEPSEFTF